MAIQPFNFGVSKSSTNEDSAVSPEQSQDFDSIAVEVLNTLIDNLQVMPEKDDEEARKQISKMIHEEIKNSLLKNKKNLSSPDKQALHDQIMDEIFGYGPITKLLDDPTITEVMVNGPYQVYVEKSGKIHPVDVKFRDDRHVFHTIDKIIAPLGRRVDESSPMVDGRLPDGSRVNVIIPPLAITGPTITIRKFAASPYTLDDLITFGTVSLEMASFFRSSVRGRMNIIVSGGTGSGKTTLLNVLSSFIPHDERIVTIEDAAELQLQQDHVISLESRPANIEGKGKITIRDLVVNTLRMRPDRIIVGEVRSAETLDMLQAMNTGHDGSITTIHANTPRDSLARMETMIHMSGVELPSRAIREQIASAINLIIQVSRFPDGSRKISKVSEITGMEGETITMQDIFIYQQDGYDLKGRVVGRHVSTGVVPTYLERLKTYGENLLPSLFKPVSQREGF
ncbi:Type II/IV secretion system protein [anaerobic digester metagenome]